MKIRRTISGLLFGLGCATVFIGALAVFLPTVQNAHLQLFLASFETDSHMKLVNSINQGWLWIVAHSWQVLSAGGLCALLGGILMLCFSKAEPAPKEETTVFQRPESEPLCIAQPEEPNPFAVAETSTLPSPAVNLLSYQRPLLDENRIDENRPHLPSSFASESLAVQTSKGEVSPSGSYAILRSSQPIRPAEPAPESETADQPAYIPSPEMTVPKLNSSRIRSTMGQHKQW